MVAWLGEQIINIKFQQVVSVIVISIPPDLYIHIIFEFI